VEESAGARDGYLRFCEGVSTGDIAAFDDIVSAEAKLIVGTAPGEHIETRDRMRFGFETEGITLTPASPRGYAEGPIGWVFDTPRFAFPDGSGIDVRVTFVLRDEGTAWRVVHAHFSVGVPDEEVVGLQARWAAA
jgi:hypothetical protein